MIVAGVVWIITMARYSMCVHTPGERTPNVYASMCYSDIPLEFIRGNFHQGATPFADFIPNQPVLVYAWMWIARTFTAWVSPSSGSVLDAETQLRLTNTYFGFSAILLFIFFLVFVYAHVFLAGKRQPWNAMMVAASPLVVTAGLINWDISAAAFVAVSMLLWQRRLPAASGALFALACAVRPYPLVIVAVLYVLAARQAKLRAIATHAAVFVLISAAIHLPVAINHIDAWRASWFTVPGLGSLWYALSLIGIKIASQTLVSLLVSGVCVIGVLFLASAARETPRLETMAFLAVCPFVAFGTVYSPQNVFWLLGLVVICFRDVKIWAIFTISELIYFATVWPFISGSFGIGTFGGFVYVAVSCLRIAVLIWMASIAINDVMSHRREPESSGPAARRSCEPDSSTLPLAK